jgi:hypothetical protein
VNKFSEVQANDFLKILRILPSQLELNNKTAVLMHHVEENFVKLDTGSAFQLAYPDTIWLNEDNRYKEKKANEMKV